jgi:hypothetical protein
VLHLCFELDGGSRVVTVVYKEKRCSAVVVVAKSTIATRLAKRRIGKDTGAIARSQQRQPTRSDKTDKKQRGCLDDPQLINGERQKVKGKSKRQKAKEKDYSQPWRPVSIRWFFPMVPSVC